MATPEVTGQYVDPITGTNPLMMIGSGALRVAGAIAYSQSMPAPDLPVYHSVSANRIFLENQYVTYQTAFRDATIARKIEALARTAEKLGIDPALVNEHSPIISMLLRADTPEMRAKIRKERGALGDGMIRLFDMATGNEANIEQVYSGLADTYGSARGNEMAAYAANYMANMFQQPSTRDDGLRDYSASSVSTTLRELQKYGYNFQAAADLKGKDTLSYDSAYREAFNAKGNEYLKEDVWNSYMDNMIAVASEEDKEDLQFIKDSSITDEPIADTAARGYYGQGHMFKDLDDLNAKRAAFISNLPQYAQTNHAEVQRSIILNNLDRDNIYNTRYKKYLKDNHIDLIDPGSNATDKEKEDYAKYVKAVQNQFASSVINGGAAEYAELYAKGTDLQRFEEIREKSQQGEQFQRANAESNKIFQEAHRRQALGQTVWDQLSADEKQQYLDANNSDIGGAQADLGASLMNKYFHEDMRRFQFDRASQGAHRLFAAAAQANLSEKQVSQQAAFIGSTMQHKGLAGIATTAAVEWQAAAKAQGIMLSDEDRLEAAQRTSRIMDSVEGGNLAMFLNQDLGENTPLGKLQKAVREGNMTPEQEKQFNEYMQNPGALLKDLSKATKKSIGDLTSEARWVEENWNSLTPEERANAINSMQKGVMLEQNRLILTEGSLERNIKSEDMDKYGVGKGNAIETDKAFRDMLREVSTSSSGMDPRAMVAGEATDADLKRLKEGGHETAYNYALERRNVRDAEISYRANQLVKEHPDWSIERAKAQAKAEVDKNMGVREINIGFNNAFQDRDRAQTALHVPFVDARAKSNLDSQGEETSVAEEVTKTSGENMKGGENPSNKNVTLEQAASQAVGKNLEAGFKWVDDMMQKFLDGLKAVFGSFLGGGNGAEGEKADKDEEGGAETPKNVADGGGNTFQNKLEGAVLAMFSKDSFVQGIGTGIGDALKKVLESGAVQKS